MMRCAWMFARSAMLDTAPGLILGIPYMLREEERNARGNNFADIEEQR